MADSKCVIELAWSSSLEGTYEPRREKHYGGTRVVMPHSMRSWGTTKERNQHKMTNTHTDIYIHTYMHIFTHTHIYIYAHINTYTHSICIMWLQVRAETDAETQTGIGHA